MPLASTITINDGAATPVARAFVPVKREGKNTTFLHSQGNTAQASALLVLGFDPATKSRPTDKISANLAFPLERGDAVSGYSADDVSRANIVVTIPDTATLLERQHLEALMRNAISAAIFKNMVTTRDAIY